MSKYKTRPHPLRPHPLTPPVLALAEVYQSAGKLKEALASVEEGLAIAARNNDRHYDAELYGVKGELLLKKSMRNSIRDSKEAEKCFLLALDIARKQTARSLELRAVMALARFWQTTQKGREAHRMLTKIYGWFTEGFDTPDLKAAKELLTELS
jgi:tetratricopeptide (TPR) repeat protein